MTWHKERAQTINVTTLLDRNITKLSNHELTEVRTLYMILYERNNPFMYDLLGSKFLTPD